MSFFMTAMVLLKTKQDKTTLTTTTFFCFLKLSFFVFHLVQIINTIQIINHFKDTFFFKKFFLSLIFIIKHFLSFLSIIKNDFPFLFQTIPFHSTIHFHLRRNAKTATARRVVVCVLCGPKCARRRPRMLRRQLRAAVGTKRESQSIPFKPFLHLFPHFHPFPLFFSFAIHLYT